MSKVKQLVGACKAKFDSQTSVLFQCRLEFFPGSKLMNCFSLPEWTHSPSSGRTRRSRSSGRRADQTWCHGGRCHPGKASSRHSVHRDSPFPLHPQAYPLWPPSLVHLRILDTPRTQWPIPVCHFLGAAVEFEDPRPMGSLSSGESKKLARPLILCSERTFNHDSKPCLT